MSITSWPQVHLSDLVADAVGGLWGAAPDSRDPEETDVLVIRGADFRDWDFRRAKEAVHRRVPRRSVERRQLRPGDLVIEVSGGGPGQPVGRVLLVDDEAVAHVSTPLICSNFCRKLRLKPGADPLFIKQQLDWLYMSGHMDQFQTSSTNLRNLQVGDFLAGTAVYAPELSRQSELASLLKSFETKRSSGRTHVAAARRALDRFTNAVMFAATSGRLTADWREEHLISVSDDYVHVLLASRRDQWMRSEPERRPLRYREPLPPEGDVLLPEGWCVASLSQLCHMDVGHAFKSTDFAASGVRLLRGENVAPGRVRWGDVRHWPAERVAEFRYLLLKEGDLVLGMDRPIISTGLKLARVTRDDLPSVLVQRVLRIRAVQRDSAKFVEICLRDGRLQRFLLHDGMTGTDLPHITGDGLARFPIPVPPPAEQVEIVRRVDALLSLAGRLMDRIAKAERALDRASLAILARTFGGESALNGGHAESPSHRATTAAGRSRGHSRGTQQGDR